VSAAKDIYVCSYFIRGIIMQEGESIMLPRNIIWMVIRLIQAPVSFSPSPLISLPVDPSLLKLRHGKGERVRVRGETTERLKLKYDNITEFW
jgi:hypothetical protein